MSKRVLVYGTASEQALVQTIMELEHENAALRADKERLDWLEDAPIERLVRITHLLITNDLDICKVSAAIDAARKEAKP